VLVASVLDVVWNGMDIALLDTSAAAHMPDVLEMPYGDSCERWCRRAEKKHTYRLGGMTCLAGRYRGLFVRRAPPAGRRLVFLDMAHYTMVKNNTSMA